MSIGNSPEDERPFEDVSGDDRPSVGRALQQARINAGLTVDDVSNATRVRLSIVHAIEAGAFVPCGGDVYARGHIRTLARAVDQLKKRGIRHPFVKNYVLARTTPLSRARKTMPSFDQTLDKLLANIEAFDVTKVRYEDVQRAGIAAAAPAE